MTALTLRAALRATHVRYIEVGGRMIGIRPSGLYSMASHFHQQALLREYSLQDAAAPWYVAMWRGWLVKDRDAMRTRLLSHIAETFVISQCLPLPRLSKRRYVRIVNEGIAYMEETTTGDNDGKGLDADIGAVLGSLQKHYGGPVSSWWEAPQYQLRAASAATAPGNEIHQEATALDYMIGMREIGFEVS